MGTQNHTFVLARTQSSATSLLTTIKAIHLAFKVTSFMHPSWNKNQKLLYTGDLGPAASHEIESFKKHDKMSSTVIENPQKMI